jgi:hypothetical protein
MIVPLFISLAKKTLSRKELERFELEVRPHTVCDVSFPLLFYLE